LLLYVCLGSVLPTRIFVNSFSPSRVAGFFQSIIILPSGDAGLIRRAETDHDALLAIGFERWEAREQGRP
jgi:hypothetical protein